MSEIIVVSLGCGQALESIGKVFDTADRKRLISLETVVRTLIRSDSHPSTFLTSTWFAKARWGPDQPDGSADEDGSIRQPRDGLRAGRASGRRRGLPSRRERGRARPTGRCDTAGP